MKVFQINTVCGYGSTGRIVTDIYKILKENGNDCKIAYGRNNAPLDIDTIKIGTKFNNYYQVFLTRFFDLHGVGSIHATKKLIKQIQEYNPDIIHLHNIHGYYINLRMLFNYLKQANKPIIWTLHDCWAFTGHCTFFSMVNCDLWKSGCKKCPQKIRYPKCILFSNAKFNYKYKKQLFTSVENMTIVTPSIWLSELVAQSFLNKYPIKVIANGIDLNIFQPTQGDFKETYQLTEKSIILGVAYKWEKRKGLDDFIELSKRLDDNKKIVLIGLNKRQIRNLPKNILGIARTANAIELAKIYSAADIFVNLSVEETMGLVTIEALACGTPVIVYNSTALPELVNDQCGFIIKVGDIDTLQNIIEKFMYGNIKKSDCFTKAKAYDKYVKYNEYMDLYSEVAGLSNK